MSDDQPPRIKLCDFGFAKEWQSDAQMFTHIGCGPMHREASHRSSTQQAELAAGSAQPAVGVRLAHAALLAKCSSAA